MYVYIYIYMLSVAYIHIYICICKSMDIHINEFISWLAAKGVQMVSERPLSLRGAKL